MNSLGELQLITRQWRNKNFPMEQRDKWRQLAGVVEEVGEMAHAILKEDQGIRGEAALHRGELADAIGDTIIYICGLCDATDLSLFECVNTAWQTVQKRNWVDNPQEG